MVSDNQFRRILSFGSNQNLGVTKQASNSGLKKMINALKMNDHDSLLIESYIREVVKDEVVRKLQEHLFSRDKNNDAGKSGSRFLELCFMNNNKLPIMTYTKTNIIPKDELFQVALFDVRSKSIVNDGPFSSIKIEICPIKDNSGWVKNKKFSLGAKAMENGEIIKEGRSKAFRVKDVRGEAYKKHYPPYLKDDVWRLKKISENGPFRDRLRSNGIHTVKDLLRLLITNESSLREKFGKIQKKCWSDIIEHARSCVVDDYMLYSYEIIREPILLLFNVIYELVGVTFDTQKFYLPDDLRLTPIQKNLVEMVKKDAYKNIENLKAIDEGTLNSISLEACIKSTQEQDVQHIDISAENGNDGMQNIEMNVDPVEDIGEIPENNYCHSIENLINVGYFEGAEWSTLVDLLSPDPFISSSNVNDGTQNVEINVDREPDIREIPGNSYDVLDGNFDEAECSTLVDMVISNIEKPKAVWCKIRAIVKWKISGKRRVAAASLEE
ncbi:unnamed protein product [Vicia faba]|uniref:Uncharacterized protein n=1 Tax=Vicia faba TaxID=3906 RepID=A0AAV1AYX3_VICFA|nr:unnamed protein product [Vicia faba]